MEEFQQQKSQVSKITSLLTLLKTAISKFDYPCKWRALIGHFRVLKTPTWKMKPSAQPFLWEWVLFPWERKIIFISKAENSTSFWYRGPGELGNDLLARSRGLLISCQISIIVQTTKKNKYYISLSRTSSWCLARGPWVWVAEPAIREAHKRVQTNINKNTLNNLTEQYFYDIKRSFPIFVKYFI